MTIPNVSIVRITELQRGDLLSEGFDPPSDDVLPNQFQKEIREVCGLVKERLSQFWKCGFGASDFHIHASSEDDRMLCVEISDMKMITPKLLNIAHTTVTELAEGYCIDFCNAWGFLHVAPERLHPNFNVFISKSRISIYSECDDLFHKLGISDKLKN